MPLPSLFEQYAAFCRAELARQFKRPAPDEADAVSIVAMLITARARRPAVHPRAVHVSRELERLRPWPPGLEEVLDEVRRGESLVPRLSRKAHEDPASQDLLFNDWGIQHLHLGVVVGRLAARTGVLLFARIANNDFYAVSVKKHGAWADKRMIDTIRANWPDIIEDSRDGWYDDDDDEWSSDSIQELRGGHGRGSISTFVKTSDGAVYLPPGGGLMLNGASTTAVRRALEIARNWTAAEKSCRARAGEQADLELVHHGNRYAVRYRLGPRS